MDVDVRWTPAWELPRSLTAFAERKGHALLDLGAPWLRRVRQELPPAFVREATAALSGETGKQLELLSTVLLLEASPELDPGGFLDWMASREVGELYEQFAPAVPDAGPGLPRDLGAARDRLHAILRRWHDTYFTTVDPALFGGLAAERDACAALVGTMPPLDLVERATNGLHLVDGFARLDVVLVPQYHYRPFNQHIVLHDRLVVCYPADVVATPADQPPPSLLRWTAALADASRLRILRYVASENRTLTEITRYVGLSQSTVHHHLVALRAAGLTRTHFGGSGGNRYSLRPDAFERLGQELRGFLTSQPVG